MEIGVGPIREQNGFEPEAFSLAGLVDVEPM